MCSKVVNPPDDSERQNKQNKQNAIAVAANTCLWLLLLSLIVEAVAGWSMLDVAQDPSALDAFLSLLDAHTTLNAEREKKLKTGNTLCSLE